MMTDNNGTALVQMSTPAPRKIVINNMAGQQAEDERKAILQKRNALKVAFLNGEELPAGTTVTRTATEVALSHEKVSVPLPFVAEKIRQKAIQKKEAAAREAEARLEKLRQQLKFLYLGNKLPAGAMVSTRDDLVTITDGEVKISFVDKRITEEMSRQREEARRKKLLERNVQTAFAPITPPPANLLQIPIKQIDLQAGAMVIVQKAPKKQDDGKKGKRGKSKR